MYSYSNRGPITKGDNRVLGWVKVLGWKACTKPQEVLRKSLKSKQKRNNRGSLVAVIYIQVCTCMCHTCSVHVQYMTCTCNLCEPSKQLYCMCSYFTAYIHMTMLCYVCYMHTERAKFTCPWHLYALVRQTVYMYIKGCMCNAFCAAKRTKEVSLFPIKTFHNGIACLAVRAI